MSKTAASHADNQILFVGHSHLAAIQSGVEQIPVWQNKFEFVQALDPEYHPLISNSATPEVHANFKRDVGEKIEKSNAVISVAFGNQHNILGLLNPPDPFEFVLRAEPDLKILNDRQLVPFGIVQQKFREMTKQLEIFLAALREITPDSIPFLHLESPPPVPSESHILKYPGPFRNKIQELGVAPAELRYKFWRAYSGVVQDICSENEITYLPVPLDVMDKNKFLKKEFWNDDPTHGNSNYGQRIVQNAITKIKILENAA